MRKFYDRNALVEDVRTAIEQALRKNGIGEPYCSLGIGAVLEAYGSPFKWAIAQGFLLGGAGMSASNAFSQSRIAFAVALAQSPHSLIVNPLMEAAAAAAARSKTPLKFEELRRNALREHLGMPKLTLRGVDREMKADSSLEPAFNSALRYLEEAAILEKTAQSERWKIGSEYSFFLDFMK